MFKNMKLASKMALGFGTIVVIVAGLGVVSWLGLKGVTTNTALEQQGSACLDRLNQCAALRRDFALTGFAVKDGENKSAADKWQEAYDELVTALQNLQGETGLDQQKKALVGDMLACARQYKEAFGQVAESRKACDEGFAAWGKVGGEVTNEVKSVQEKVIGPAQAAALESKELEQITQWASFGERLDKDVVQQFLLLRVCAVYLIATRADAQWKNYQDQLAGAKASLAGWTQTVTGNTELEAVANRIRGYYERYEAAGEQFRKGILSDRAAGDEMAVVAGKLVASTNQLKQDLQDDAHAITSRTYTLVTSVAVSAIVLGILLAVVITRSIVKPVNRIITALTEGANQVSEAAGQVSVTSQQLAEGASEQASSLEETSSALEEMAAMTRKNAENSKQANDLSEQARNAAQSGDQTMHRLNGAMTGINESSDKISKIIKVIEEIAFQTNLLALNAAVEAARAGEHGKGFAVVAEEVRNLAQRAAQAARETTGLIEESVQRSREGTDVARDVAEALGGIVADVAKVTELVNGIARASEEQAQGVEQVNTAVAQMDKVTQSNAAGAEESASAAQELSAQAVAVNKVVGDLATLVNGASATRQVVSTSSATMRSRTKARLPAATRATHSVLHPHGAGGEPAAHDGGPHNAAPSKAPAAEDMKLDEF